MHYVYKLQDPRDGVTFYIGKGTGDRAWIHQREVVNGKARGSVAKVTRIREILAAGQQVVVVIVAEYPDAADALDHEFHLIDADATLTNQVAGGTGGGELSPLRQAVGKHARLKKLHEDLLQHEREMQQMLERRSRQKASFAGHAGENDIARWRITYVKIALDEAEKDVRVLRRAAQRKRAVGVI